eukprot:403350158
MKSQQATKSRELEGSENFIPEDWQKLWDVIMVMRSENPAPVDSMGSSCLADSNATPNEFAFQTLIGLMLSSQTKDEVTAEAVGILLQNGLSIKMIDEIKEQDLNRLIEKVGFHNKKAIYLKKAARQIIEDYKGIVPSDYDKLIALPGVGPKMAHLLLQNCFDKTVGISVDTHVHRIANRLKWVPKQTKTPGETAKALQEWLPQDKWEKINWMLVGFGQMICKPIGPRCYECKARDLCPFEPKSKPPTKSKSKIAIVKSNDDGVINSTTQIDIEEEVKEQDLGFIENQGIKTQSKTKKTKIKSVSSKSKDYDKITIQNKQEAIAHDQVLDNQQQISEVSSKENKEEIKNSKKRKMNALDNFKFVDKTNNKRKR